jgi:hypothetical protein
MYGLGLFWAIFDAIFIFFHKRHLVTLILSFFASCRYGRAAQKKDF